jgi:hypothetical protein
MVTFLLKTEQESEKRIVRTNKDHFSRGDWIHTSRGQRVTKEE